MAATEQSIPQAIMPPGFYVLVCWSVLSEKTACQLSPLKTALSRCVYYGCASDLYLYKTSLTKYISWQNFSTPKVGDGRKNVRAHTLPPYVVCPYYMSYHKLWCATYPKVCLCVFHAKDCVKGRGAAHGSMQFAENIKVDHVPAPEWPQTMAA